MYLEVIKSKWLEKVFYISILSGMMTHTQRGECRNIMVTVENWQHWQFESAPRGLSELREFTAPRQL